LTELSADDVVRFLRENPAFFDEHAELLSEITVPHPHGGRAIALSDRLMLGLRDKNKALEGKLSELIQFGEENDVISEKVHRLSVAMMATRTLPSMLHETYYNLREDFQVPHVALRVWRGAGDQAEFDTVSDELKAYAADLDQPFCGPNANFEAVGWFGEAGPHVRSVAFVPLAELDQTFGMLALGSEDLLRFYPEMGTLYLKRIGDLVAAGLLRFL
jgi:uncharacterized protein YigA (DUF484 family)